MGCWVEIWPYVTENERSCRVVLQYWFGSLGCIWVRITCNPTSLGSIDIQEGQSGIPGRVTSRKLDLVIGLKNRLGYPACYQRDWLNVLSNILNWQDTTTIHLSLRVSYRWENQSRAIDKTDISTIVVQIKRLEMLGLSWHGSDSDSFGSTKNINQRRLTNIRISYCSYIEPVVRVSG